MVEIKKRSRGSQMRFTIKRVLFYIFGFLKKRGTSVGITSRRGDQGKIVTKKSPTDVPTVGPEGKRRQNVIPGS